MDREHEQNGIASGRAGCGALVVRAMVLGGLACAWEPDAQIGRKTRPLRDLRIGDEAFRPNEPVRCSYSLCEVDGELWALGACDPDEDG